MFSMLSFDFYTYTHTYIYMYVYNLSPLGFSLAITVLLWVVGFFLNQGAVKYLAALSEREKRSL